MGVTVNVVKCEQVVVASVLTNDTPPGPATCTALAYWPYWESPEASKLAQAIVTCISRGVPAIKANVQHQLDEHYKRWVRHPVFSDGLPMGLAEVEARSLLPHYKSRRIMALVAKAYQEMLEKPHDAPQIALYLKLTLGDMV